MTATLSTAIGWYGQRVHRHLQQPPRYGFANPTRDDGPAGIDVGLCTPHIPGPRLPGLSGGVVR